MAKHLAADFDRADSRLAMCEQRLEGSFAAAFPGADAKLNPARLQKRLEAELPALRAAAEANRADREAVLGPLTAALCSNRSAVLGAAGLAAAAGVADADGEWCSALAEAEQCAASRMPLAHRPSAPGAASSPAPPTPACTASAAVSELAWLRLSQSDRMAAGSREELNEFWSLLRGLFVRRETGQLQAAQLLALGVRMTDANARKLKLLERCAAARARGAVLPPARDPWRRRPAQCIRAVRVLPTRRCRCGCGGRRPRPWPSPHCSGCDALPAEPNDQHPCDPAASRRPPSRRPAADTSQPADRQQSGPPTVRPADPQDHHARPPEAFPSGFRCVTRARARARARARVPLPPNARRRHRLGAIRMGNNSIMLAT